MSGRLLAAALVTSALVGCASVPQSPGERRDDQLSALEARVLELSQKAAVQEVELSRLRQQVASLEARLAGRGGAGAASSSGTAGVAGTVGTSTARTSTTGSASTAGGAVAPPVATPGAR
ncbi:MAG TPA: hypothetical protein VFS60_19535, partial [Thermoanaerobaculia bacterium]|nr:hypothetical protein [Thermoanaerobaculia bacterium]